MYIYLYNPVDEYTLLEIPTCFYMAPLSMLKKLCPKFYDLLSLDFESCQFIKHHRLSYNPRVNKRASAPFECYILMFGVLVTLYQNIDFNNLLLLLMMILV